MVSPVMAADVRAVKAPMEPEIRNFNGYLLAHGSYGFSSGKMMIAWIGRRSAAALDNNTPRRSIARVNILFEHYLFFVELGALGQG